jgi:hypothetical protein
MLLYCGQPNVSQICNPQVIEWRCDCVLPCQGCCTVICVWSNDAMMTARETDVSRGKIWAIANSAASNIIWIHSGLNQKSFNEESVFNRLSHRTAWGRPGEAFPRKILYVRMFWKHIALTTLPECSQSLLYLLQILLLIFWLFNDAVSIPEVV